mmetsp:Transcript_9032/g.17034  ORF Transcript_9032/g.17034 Transcript_9032/m.17034 type:complete len:507 (+) Transcript_9032:125-1645(+)
MSDISKSGNWALGVSLGLLGSIAINTGNNIQSLALKSLKNDGRKYRSGKPKTVPVDDKGECVDTVNASIPNPCSSSLWLIGTTIFITGSLLNFVSYAFAAQSMLASLESVQFVTNLVFGKFMLKAEINRTMMYGTLLTVLGTIIAVQFSSKATLSFSIAEMVQLYRNPSYISYLAVTLLSMIILSYIYKKHKKQKLRGRQLRRTAVIMPLCYSLWSALCGTQSVVQAKILAELLAIQVSGTENIFKSKLLYVTIILWLITAWIWLSRLNNSLREFDPLFIIPMLQCSFIFFAIISGGIFFREFDTFSWSQWLGFWSGVFVMFTGLRLLTPKQEGENDNIQNSRQEDEEEENQMNPSITSTTITLVTTNPTTPPLLFSSPSNTSMKQPHNAATTTESMHPHDTKDSATGREIFLPQLDEESTYKSPPPPPPRSVSLGYLDNISDSSTTASSSSSKMRQSVTVAALKAIKDTLIESTQSVVHNMSTSSVLLTPPNGTAILTKAQKILI